MLEIIYQSADYKPERVTDKYLHVDIKTGKVVISETEKTKKTNYTIRSYFLPITEHYKYKNEIAEAEKIKHCFPHCIKIMEV